VNFSWAGASALPRWQRWGVGFDTGRCTEPGTVARTVLPSGIGTKDLPNYRTILRLSGRDGEKKCRRSGRAVPDWEGRGSDSGFGTSSQVSVLSSQFSVLSSRFRRDAACRVSLPVLKSFVILSEPGPPPRPVLARWGGEAGANAKASRGTPACPRLLAVSSQSPIPLSS
jgi:hypothetical protein